MKPGELKRKTGLKPKRRKPSEYARIYGSRARVEAIKRMRCAVPGCGLGPCHNAHIRNGGMGRKSDWTDIVPLCGRHHFAFDDQLGSVELFDRRFGTDLEALAARLAVEVLP